VTPPDTYRAALGLRLARVSDYLSLTKPGLTATSVATAVCAALLGSTGANRAGVALHVLVGSGLLGAGAVALNQVLERGRDAAMKRTFRRPVASGRVNPASAGLFGGFLAAAGLLYLLAFTHPLAAALGAATLVLYLLVYTPLKTVTPYSTLIGAVPGALPPLVGWSAATGSVSLEGWVLFAIIFFWQIPHFLALSWMYREDYEKGGYRFLPTVDRSGYITAAQMVLYSVALLTAAMLPFFLGMVGGWYLAWALLISSLFSVRCLLFLLERSAARARSVFFWSLGYLPALATVLLIESLR
jgi:heme o synthase